MHDFSIMTFPFPFFVNKEDWNASNNLPFDSA